MNTLHERKNDLEKEKVELTKRLKDIDEELKRIYEQIRQNDESEIQQEIEQEASDLQDGLSQGRYWKKPSEKRKRKQNEEIIRTEDEEAVEEECRDERKRIRKWKVEIKELLEEVPESELNGTVETIERNREDIAQLFDEVCKQEKMEKRDNLLRWYDYAQRLSLEITEIMEKDALMSKDLAVGKIYDKIMERYPSYTRENIRKKTEVARKVYRIYSQVGGKEKIKRIKKTSIRKIGKLTVEQIQEWERSLVTNVVGEMSEITTPKE